MVPHKPALWGLGTEFREEDEKKQPHLLGATPTVAGLGLEMAPAIILPPVIKKKNSYIAFPTCQVQ